MRLGAVSLILSLKSMSAMTTNILIQRATAADAQGVAVLVGDLLAEIMNATNFHAFNFDLAKTTARLKGFLDKEQYFVFVARNDNLDLIGFIALYESYALYAEGAFGTIAELFVRAESRSNKVGQRLVSQAKSLGEMRGWKRLEVTTPPLPQFEKTLSFYEREGFSITGGRKLKVAL